MGGFSTTRIDGHLVEFGDLLRVETQDGWVAARFLEVSDCGTIWMECVRDEDSFRGDSVFSDNLSEVWQVRFGCKKDDPILFLGDGI